MSRATNPVDAPVAKIRSMEWMWKRYPSVRSKILKDIKACQMMNCKKNMSFHAAARKSRLSICLAITAAQNVARYTGIRFVGTRSFKTAAHGIVKNAASVGIGASGIAKHAIGAPTV
jgi:hypothetical protein